MEEFWRVFELTCILQTMTVSPALVHCLGWLWLLQQWQELENWIKKQPGWLRHLQRGGLACSRFISGVSRCCCCSSTRLPWTGACCWFGCCCCPCFCPFLHLTCLVFSWRRSRAPASVMPSVAVSVAVRRSRRARSRQVITIEAKKLGKLTQWGITNHPTYILCYCHWFSREGSIQCVLIQDARDSPICRRCKILKLSILTFCTSQYILRWL